MTKKKGQSQGRDREKELMVYSRFVYHSTNVESLLPVFLSVGFRPPSST